MRPRGGAAVGLGFGLALLATCAFAQGNVGAPNKAKRPPPAPAPAPVVPTDGATGLPNALELPALPGAALLHPAPSTGATTLRSAVRSRWSDPATIRGTGQAACRAQCSTTRLSCRAVETEPSLSRCDSAWTNCLSTCGGLTYGRAAPNGG